MINTRHVGFGIEESDACKGVAVLLLLWHHLFLRRPEYGPAAQMLAGLAKVCVPMFVFLSGYGLAKSQEQRRLAYGDFLVRRFGRLYETYWFVWLCFVPLGFVLGRLTLAASFGEHPWPKLLIQFLGFHRLVYDEYGLNPTWWYMSAILVLYLVFPLVIEAVRNLSRAGLLILLVLVVVFRPGPERLVAIWALVPAFAAGAWFGVSDGFLRLSARLPRAPVRRVLTLVAVLFPVAGWVAVFWMQRDFITASLLDWLFALLLIALVAELTRLSRPAARVLGFVGRHAYAVFLFHTFLYARFIPNTVYWTSSAPGVFLTFAGGCLLLAQALEWLRRATGYSSLFAWALARMGR